jgi:hypothetical protein
MLRLFSRLCSMALISANRTSDFRANQLGSLNLETAFQRNR